MKDSGDALANWSRSTENNLLSTRVSDSSYYVSTHSASDSGEEGAFRFFTI